MAAKLSVGNESSAIPQASVDCQRTAVHVIKGLKEQFVEESLTAINNSSEAGTMCQFKKRHVEEDLKRLWNHHLFYLHEQARMQNWFSTKVVREYLEHIGKVLGSIKVAITLLEQWQSIAEMEILVAQKALNACDTYHGNGKDMPARKRKREKSPDDEEGRVSGK